MGGGREREKEEEEEEEEEKFFNHCKGLGSSYETGCLLSYRQLISGCRRVRYPLTTDALSLSHDVRSLLPRKEFRAWPPLEEFGDVSACDQ